MDVVVEMLEVEMLEVERTPAQAILPSSSVGANLELALVGSDQTEVMPAIAKDAPALRGISEVAIVRAVVSPDCYSPTEEVGESLK